MKIRLVSCLAGLLIVMSARAVGAAPLYEEVFANIGEGNAGTNVNGRLIQAADGNFYGTAQQGAVQYGGSVFRLTPSGKLTAFHAFYGGFDDFGNTPLASLAIGVDGNFYGTTTDNSANGSGSIFKLTPGNKITVVSFLAPYEGAFTQLTIARDGTFYAAKYAPPSYPQQPFPIDGVIRFKSDGTILFITDLQTATTGSQPRAPLVEGADGSFYGAASAGGSKGCGTIFRVTPTGVITVFHTFNGPDGKKPESSLVFASDGNFYGTTTRGGAHDKGTIFRLTRAGVLATLVSFTGANGSLPTGGLTVGADGNLYGTTNLGGTNDKGAFYRLTLSGVLTTLASFSTSTGTVPANGVTLAFDGNFYGTTIADGDYLYGTAYRVTPTGVITKLASFGESGGYTPISGVIQGTDGNFYGTAGGGGINNSGTVFKILPSGSASTLATFPVDGGRPTPLAQGADGSLFGATASGGANEVGMVYKLSLSGTLAKLADLSDETGREATDFLRGRDGNFYGLTGSGGSTSNGTIFRITPTGAISQFAPFNRPTYFTGHFSQDSDGNFYGTFQQSQGFAFKVDSSGAATTLADFDTMANGQEPGTGLTRGPDGNFYGMTGRGGPSNNGTLFRLTPSGTITPLSSVGGGTGLVRNADGSFFGTSADSIFRATTAGIVESWPVFDFLDSVHGFGPSGSLTPASDGYIYGTAAEGGSVGGGVVYRFTTSSPILASFSPASARPRESIVLTGRYLAGASAVTFNGVPAASFSIDSSSKITAVVPTGAHAGAIKVTNPLGTATTATSFTPLPPIPRFQNISTRAQVLTGDNVLIAGFIITGIGQKEVILRALGPSLSTLRVRGALQDPVLELHDHTGALIALNDNWSDTQQVVIQPTNLAPADARESAIFRPLSPGAYTAIMKGKNNTTGVGLVEVYDLSNSPSLELANISSRGFVGSGDDVMIAGLIVGETGSGPSRELLRALGPSLSNAHVAGPLQNPRLELHNSNGALLAVNDNWATDPHSAQIQAEGFAPSDPRESAILPTLAPGAYTVIVRGVKDTTGVALVEAYNLH